MESLCVFGTEKMFFMNMYLLGDGRVEEGEKRERDEGGSREEKEEGGGRGGGGEGRFEEWRD